MIILRQKQYSNNEVDPLYELDYKGLCKLYPKLKELKFFIDNSKKLSDIEFQLDRCRIVIDWPGLSCDLYNPDYPDLSGVDEYSTNEIRKALKSDDWISCIGYGELSYNTKDNKFYQLDLYSRNAIKIIKPITVENYKKELYKNIVSWCKEEIKKNNNLEPEKQCPDFEKEVNKCILQPLKKIFKL